MPYMKATRPVCEDSVKEEVTVNESLPIKEEIVDEERNDDNQCEYDTANEQMQHSFGTSQQEEDHNSEHDTESVGPKVMTRKRQHTKNVEMKCHLKSTSSAILIGPDVKTHVHDAECFTHTNKSVTKKKCLLKPKEPQGTVIQSSHTTILTSKDKKRFLCQVCEMLFDSIEAALTHRFKEHSHEEFSNQVQA